MRPEIIAGLIVVGFSSVLSLGTVTALFAWMFPSALNWVGGKMITGVWGDKIWYNVDCIVKFLTSRTIRRRLLEKILGLSGPPIGAPGAFGLRHPDCLPAGGAPGIGPIDFANCIGQIIQ